jgi:hypothetical protein
MSLPPLPLTTPTPTQPQLNPDPDPSPKATTPTPTPSPNPTPTPTPTPNQGGGGHFDDENAPHNRAQQSYTAGESAYENSQVHAAAAGGKAGPSKVVSA